MIETQKVLCIKVVYFEELEAKVKRRHYAGKPTRKYRKLLKMEERFEMNIIGLSHRLGLKPKI